MKEISIHELKEGQLFKFNKRQRNFRIFSKLRFITHDSICPEHMKGQYLLIQVNCSQTLLSENSKVFIKW